MNRITAVTCGWSFKLDEGYETSPLPTFDTQLNNLHVKQYTILITETLLLVQLLKSLFNPFKQYLSSFELFLKLRFSYH